MVQPAPAGRERGRPRGARTASFPRPATALYVPAISYVSSYLCREGWSGTSFSARVGGSDPHEGRLWRFPSVSICFLCELKDGITAAVWGTEATGLEQNNLKGKGPYR